MLEVLRCRGVSCSNALLALVEEPQLGALVGVDDGQDLGDTLADVMDAGELGGRATGDLSSPERDQLAVFQSASCPLFLKSFHCGRRTT